MLLVSLRSLTGISDNPDFKHSNPNFKYREIVDDPDMGLGIKKNYMSFAGSGVNSRSTQIFIAFEDLNWLGPRPGSNPDGPKDGSQTAPNSILLAFFGSFNHGNSIFFPVHRDVGNPLWKGCLGTKYVGPSLPRVW